MQGIMKISIGVREESLEQVSKYLNAVLADEYVLFTKTKKAHWNVEGQDFYSKHLLFEKQFTELDGIIDDVAERIRTIGHFVTGSLKDFLSLSHMTEKSINGNDSIGFIADLLEDHQTIIVKIREILENKEGFLDLGTNDFMSGVMAAHEKMAWMLRSSLK